MKFCTNVNRNSRARGTCTRVQAGVGRGVKKCLYLFNIMGGVPNLLVFVMGQGGRVFTRQALLLHGPGGLFLGESPSPHPSKASSRFSPPIVNGGLSGEWVGPGARARAGNPKKHAPPRAVQGGGNGVPEAL